MRKKHLLIEKLFFIQKILFSYVRCVSTSNPTGMAFFGHFDHSILNIVQNVKFLQLKRQNNDAKK